MKETDPEQEDEINQLISDKLKDLNIYQSVQQLKQELINIENYARSNEYNKKYGHGVDENWEFDEIRLKQSLQKLWHNRIIKNSNDYIVNNKLRQQKYIDHIQHQYIDQIEDFNKIRFNNVNKKILN